MKGILTLQILTCLLLSISFSHSGKGQVTALTDSAVLVLQTTGLTEALKQLSEETGLSFAYRSNLLKNKNQNKTTFSGTIEHIMLNILEPHDLCFTEKNGQIIIHTSCRPKYTAVSGRIISSRDQIPIPYVSVSLANLSVGVIADHEGYFELLLDYTDLTDTLIFSCMGYKRDTVLVEASNNKPLLVLLDEKIYALPEFVIKPEQFEVKKAGNNKGKPMGSLYLDTHGQQSALFIENKSNKIGSIESIEYFLSKKGNIKAPFRVRVYSVDTSGLPGKDLIQDAIVVKPNESKGWYKVDLSNENLVFPKEGIFVAIEGVFPDDYEYYFDGADFIDLKRNSKSGATEHQLSYGQRLGYNRKYKKETWHYSMSKIWFQIEKQAFGIMVSANIKYVKNADKYDQKNK